MAHKKVRAERVHSRLTQCTGHQHDCIGSLANVSRGVDHANHRSCAHNYARGVPVRPLAPAKVLQCQVEFGPEMDPVTQVVHLLAHFFACALSSHANIGSDRRDLDRRGECFEDPCRSLSHEIAILHRHNN